MLPKPAELPAIALTALALIIFLAIDYPVRGIDHFGIFTRKSEVIELKGAGPDGAALKWSCERMPSP